MNKARCNISIDLPFLIILIQIMLRGIPRSGIQVFKLTIIILFQIIALFEPLSITEAMQVFPGATGFGIETPAGRSGQVIHVTNLNVEGRGSLKEAIDTPGPRVVVFEVSGNIEIKGRLVINNPFITIAGQTAPSPGVTLKECTLTINTHDVLIQHLRIRTGDMAGIDPDTRDVVNIGFKNPREKPYNIVVDHCSISWGIDENIESNNCSNITWSYCIISEPLSRSFHSKGEHSKAFLAQHANNLSLIGNIIAHSNDRNPVIGSGVTAVLANNLIYNPGDFNIRLSIPKDISKVSIVSNVTIKGENTRYTAARKIPSIWKAPASGTKIYLSDNTCHAGTQISPEDWTMVRNATALSDASLQKRVKVSFPPVWIKDFVAMPSFRVKEYLVANAGARPLDRDEVDQRIINDILANTGRIIHTPSQVGGWPKLLENRRALSLPDDPKGDRNNDGYTNLEEWLHEWANQVENRIEIPAS